MKFNRLLSSQDIFSKPSTKAPKLLPRAKQADPNQRRSRNSQISKDSNLYNDKRNNLRHRYPSIETTGIPLNSGREEPIGVKAPSYDERKRVVHTEVPNTRKWSVNHPKIELEIKRGDTFNSFALNSDSCFIYNRHPGLEIPVRGQEIFQNLSLSIIQFEEDVNQNGPGLLRRATIFESSLKLDSSFELPIKEADGSFEPWICEESVVKQELISGISAIQERSRIANDIDVNTLDAIFLSGVVLDLDLSKSQFEKEIVDVADMGLDELLMIPKEFKALDISAVLGEDKWNDSHEVKELLVLIHRDFSLELELSMVNMENNVIDCSDIADIEEFLISNACR